ncbi:unnamed protein product [Acanthocheilonema viteae]|uniref:Uncharacterized protein n=1 Tax=Acanthocheilonema viteae TaxID=6277 RepID=A0A498SLK7_ACAVI|nr:unnamed protein product [Acanthocheilonema viteae]
MDGQLLALMAQTVAVLAMIMMHLWFEPTDVNEMKDNGVDSDGNKDSNSSRDSNESTDNRVNEEDIDECKDERRKRIYMEEIWEMIREQKNIKGMKDMNKKLEMKLKDAREMKLLRKITTNSERQMAAICKGAQNQWFGVIEACKHSIYVNNV